MQRRRAAQPLPDIVWLRPDGTLMQPEDWDSGFGRAIGVFLNGDGIRERDARGEPIIDQHFLCCSTPATTPSTSRSRATEFSPTWDVIVDTAGEQRRQRAARSRGATVSLQAKVAASCSRAHTVPEAEPDHSVAASLAALAVRPTPLDDEPAEPRRRPSWQPMTARPPSTYRLQIRPAFDLDAAAAVAGYLARPRRRLGRTSRRC